MSVKHIIAASQENPSVQVRALNSPHGTALKPFRRDLLNLDFFAAATEQKFRRKLTYSNSDDGVWLLILLQSEAFLHHRGQSPRELGIRTADFAPGGTVFAMIAIDTIPPEVLVQIFLESFSSNSNADVIISPRQGPLLISQISRKWRNVALSYPQLWSSFSITVTPSSRPQIICMLKLWLKRSSLRLLSFTLLIKRFSLLNSDLIQLSQSILRELAAESRRWKRITMFLPGSQQLLRGLFTYGAPNLEYISFHLGNWKTNEINDITSILRLAPSLKILAWSNRETQWTTFDTPFDSGLCSLHVSWDNLTDVDLDTWITWKTALGILRRCSKIITFNLRHFAYGPSDAETKEDCTPILLNHLSTLAIYQLELDHNLVALFDKLTCPALRHFHFTCGFIRYFPWPQSSFLDFLVRSDCHLITLSLEYTDIKEDQLLQCLIQGSSSLSRLQVYSNAAGAICVGDKLLQQLHHRSTAFDDCATLCPNLQTLVLHRNIQCAEGALLAMLQSRMPTAIPQHRCTKCAVSMQQVNLQIPKCWANNADLISLRNLATVNLF